jgi:diguanylate cyclase (GGDEF)-like protein
MLQAIEQSKRHRRVLFVDDSRLMRFAGGKFLDGHCDLVLAKDGREAWEMLERDDQIDLIFTDLMMPVMDGYELIRRIRQSEEPRIRHVPLLVVTGEDELNARELALSQGASGFIAKPFTPDDLRCALDADRHKKHQQASEHTPRIRALPTAAGAESRGRHRLQEPGDFCHRLHQAISFHQRQLLDLSLLHVQFQGYWRLNNRFGRHWADAVMRNVHRILREELRDEDSIHRTADDMYSVIMMATGRESARTPIRRLRHRLVNTRMRFSSMEVPIDVRFAIQCPDLDDDQDPQELLDDAFRLLHWRSETSRRPNTPVT